MLFTLLSIIPEPPSASSRNCCIRLRIASSLAPYRRMIMLPSLQPERPSVRLRRPLDAPAERVARSFVTRLVTRREPLLAFRRGAVRPRFRRHLALELLLDSIIANRRRGVEPVCDISISEVRDDPRLCRMVRPHTRKAVRL